MERHIEGEQPGKREAHDRRGFLQRVAALGGGLTLAGLTGAEAAPPKTGPTKMAPIKRTNPATKRLTFMTPLAVARPRGGVSQLPEGDPAEVVVLSGEAPSPASRASALAALRGMPGGAEALNRLGISSATGAGSLSRALGTMRSFVPLAQSYADGMTLTTTEIIYAGAEYEGIRPLRYTTNVGYVTEDITHRQRCCVCRLPATARTMPLINFHMKTPGSPTERLTYLMEICVTPHPTSPLESLELCAGDEVIPSSITSGGRLAALVELPGTVGTNRWAHVYLRTTHAGYFYMDFRWFDIKAL